MNKDENVEYLLNVAGKETDGDGTQKVIRIFYGASDDTGFSSEIVTCTFQDGIWTDELGMARIESEMTPGEVIMLNNSKQIADDGTITSSWSRYVKCVCENGVWRDEFGNTWADADVIKICSIKTS